MPQIATGTPELRALTGLHLWHAGNSNCSQRVRLVLAEKWLPWTGHPVDLYNFEHATPAYRAVHPKGLVPALIHDGRTIIDSNDIIAYLDATFPGDSLEPTVAGAEALFELAADCQLSLRTLSHEFMFKETRRYTVQQLDTFAVGHGYSEFAHFLRRFSLEGFSKPELLACFDTIAAAAATLDGRLAEGEWLGGPAVSLIDFCWLPNIHRLELLRFPLTGLDSLHRWLTAMQARPSYATALADYEGGFPPVSASERQRRDEFFATAAQHRARRQTLGKRTDVER